MHLWRVQAGKTTMLSRRAIEHDWFLFVDPINTFNRSVNRLSASSSLNTAIVSLLREIFIFFFACEMTPKFARLKNSEICTFLEILENYPIIWNIKLKDYSNRPMREGQITMMLIDLEKKNLKMHEEEFRGKPDVIFFGGGNIIFLGEIKLYR